MAKPLVKYPVKSNGDLGVPLGLLYLAAHVQRHNRNVDVSFIDYRLEKFKGLQRNLESDMADFDVVACGASTTELSDMLNIFTNAKNLGKTTIAGGIFPSSNAEFVLSSGVVDYVVRGEGEETFSELLEAIRQKKPVSTIKGFSYISDGNIVHNTNREQLNLETISLPAYDLIDMKDYVGNVTGSVYSARGCNMTCDFCTVSKHWRHKYRTEPIENVLAQMRILAEHGFERIHFKDESMVQDRQRSIRLFSAIRDAGLGVSIKGKARLDELDDELLYLLKSAGVDMIHIGVESVSLKSLKDMHKGITASDIKAKLEQILSFGIGINPVYMLSWPGETPADLMANAEFMTALGSNPGVVTYLSFITPHPGTKLYEQAKIKQLRIISDDLDRYNHKTPVAVPESLGDDGLEQMVSVYHSVTQELGMKKVNPPIDPEYYEKISFKPKMAA